MSDQQPLQGSCSCGRFTYIVLIPETQRKQAQVHFRTNDQHRRSQATLLTAWLRVPLGFYQTRTIPYNPDESHNSISRTFSPVNEPYSQRKFCGYCGTHLSYWTEEPREEQEYIHVTLGSLRSRDLDTLQDLDLLPEDAKSPTDHTRSVSTIGEEQTSELSLSGPDTTSSPSRRGTERPTTWFEEMLVGSHLGRAQRTQRGAGISVDGTTTVSWEITEFNDDNDVVMTTPEPGSGSGTGLGSKRKIADTT